MLNFMAENHGNRLGINTNEKIELEYLRKEVQRLKTELRLNQSPSTDNDYSESDNDSSEAEESVADLISKHSAIKNLKPRVSVSAESFGSWNKKGDF